MTSLLNIFRKHPLVLILGIAFLARALFAFFSSNLHTDYYWEYGELGKNVLQGNGYSLFYFQGEHLEYLSRLDSSPFPSAFMPPGYVAFLVPFLLLKNLLLRNALIFLAQIVVALLSIAVLYRLTARTFNTVAACIAGLFAALLPDFVYAATSFTPTVLSQLLFLLLVWELTPLKSSFVLSRVFRISLLAVMLIYLRSEMLLYLCMVLIAMAFARQTRQVLAIATLVVIALAPWALRNKATLGEAVPITTNMGLNLFRGENQGEVGSFGNPYIDRTVSTLPHDSTFELAYNRLYTDQALDWIRSSPRQAMKKIPGKLFDLWVYSTMQEQRLFWAQCAVSIMLLIFFAIGFIRSFSLSAHMPLYLYLLHATLVTIVFFALPRHQTMMRIGMLPFVGVGTEYLLRKIGIVRSS
jgi:hypothetical protein